MLRLSIALVALGLVPPAAAADPLTAPAFSATPAQLQRLFRDVKNADGEHVVIGLESGHYRFDARGNYTFTLHRIYKVQTATGVSGWDKTAAGYAPWHQDKPVLRARVIDPSGRVATLDPKSISAAPSRSGSPHTYCDHRRVEAPLPGVAVGTIIEEEIVRKTRAPYFDAGDMFSFVVDAWAPIHRVRLTVDAPANLPLQFRSRGPVKLRRKRARRGGRKIITFLASDVPRRPEGEPYRPSDRPSSSYVEMSTGASWRAVATAYAAIIDRQIAASPIE
jgi:hypothetical protein